MLFSSKYRLLTGEGAVLHFGNFAWLSSRAVTYDPALFGVYHFVEGVLSLVMCCSFEMIAGVSFLGDSVEACFHLLNLFWSLAPEIL